MRYFKLVMSKYACEDSERILGFFQAHKLDCEQLAYNSGEAYRLQRESGEKGPKPALYLVDGSAVVNRWFNPSEEELNDAYRQLAPAHEETVTIPRNESVLDSSDLFNDVRR